MKEKDYIREQLVYLLTGGGAHINFVDAVKNFPENKRGIRIPNLAHTAWQLIDHLRIVQWDIVEFIINPYHISPEFPSGYWPKEGAPRHSDDWEKALEQIGVDLNRMLELVQNHNNDLFLPIPHGTGQTLFREALLLADHNSYHIGQLVDVKKLLGIPVND
ncbi:MAG: DinB family protein [Spirochaetales bacterium]|nr:DinB family protein [Spirochaetales bacterium]